MTKDKSTDSGEDRLKNSLTPKEIVKELDRYIVGQSDAKKAVALALRNRYRRQLVDASLQDEIVPKNILMVGPTGVGKTEIARRLAHLAEAPFIKVEATKFTEVGYVGRDVESMIRDLVEMSVKMVRKKYHKQQYETAKEKAEERILTALVGEGASEPTKQKFKEMLAAGELEDKEIEINVSVNNKPSAMPTFDFPGGQMGIVSVGEMIGKALGADKKNTAKKMKVKDSRDLLIEEEVEKLVEEDKIISDAISIAENNGIVFIDEIDKIISSSENPSGRDISREGVQRDLLPIIEGTTITTKYGAVKTDHILFIASGAFHISKPSNLLPELQGRLPIRVELKDLTKEDMIRILKEPEASLIKQYIALLGTEHVKLSFSDEAIEHIADTATTINRDVENIGARRLHTIMEKLLEEISFNASDKEITELNIDEKYVDKHLGNITKQLDLSKFIL